MLKDSFNRLMKTSLISEVTNGKKTFADIESIKTFETNLRELVIGDNASEAIDAAVSLYTAYLSVRSELEEAEFFLLSVIGLQAISHGFIVELTLGEIYLNMKEYPRAKRFLEVAVKSSQESVSKRASELLELTEKASSEA
jgi:tetratricopeptide (TPR) repeat protein